MRQLGLVLAVLVLVVQIVKGLSIETSLYPLLSYIFTYEDGPLRRGLLPTIFASLGITDLADIGRQLARMHVLLITVLAGVLLARMAQLPYPADRARRWLLWLLLGSAVLPVLAATTGYIDVLLALSLILIAALLAQGYTFSAAGVLLVLAMQHEMALVPGLTLFAAEALLAEAQRKRVIIAGVVVLGLSVGLLALSASYQPGLMPLAEARCADMRPAAHNLVAEVWDKYCVRQARATMVSDFTPTRLISLPFFLLVYGVMPLALLFFGYTQARSGGTALKSLALFGLMAAPYALITIAWDSDRFIILASITGWLIVDRWLQVQPLKGTHSAVGYMIAALVAVQLAFTYPAIDVYGQKRIVPPNLERHYLVDTRQFVLPVLAHYNLTVPVFLRPEICIDLRCNR